MRVILCGLVIVAAVTLAGCGGGGGAGQQLVGSSAPTGASGTYRVTGLGLPSDQMGVQSNGDIVVNSESSATRGVTSQAKIGTCNVQGGITLAGGWRSGGVDYSISGSGLWQPQSGTLTLQAAVTGTNGLRHEGAAFVGDKVSDLDLPPPPPDYPPDDGGGMDMPPPPPY